MAGNVLDRLAEVKVPPLPVNFRQRVHQRLNHYLLLGHVADVVLRALPYAMWHMLRALLASTVFTVTGKYGDPPPRNEGHPLP